jgi:hypothetical protein
VFPSLQFAGRVRAQLVLQVEDPLSEMLGKRHVLNFGIFSDSGIFAYT